MEKTRQSSTKPSLRSSLSVDVVVENLLLVRGLREAVKEVERLIRLQEPYAENLQGFARLLGIQWVHTNLSAMLSPFGSEYGVL